MEYKIEKNVPMKKEHGKYPFGEMEVGDSFAYPVADATKVTTASYQYGKLHNKKFKTRRTCDKFARCWRIA